jgi:uncharacterized repeat protein (TIGR03837 family)
MRWDLYCRVVDNFGDAGVAWRLAAELARRGERVRLAIDDPRPLVWMAPGGAPGVEVGPWEAMAEAPADRVVELFGAGLPESAKEAAAAATPPTLVVNLEHLSAEAYVERSHGLPSPQVLASGRTLTTWFYFPGFTSRTGGLLRESDLLVRRSAFEAEAWLASLGIQVRDGERRVSLFCYPNEAVASLLEALATEPTLLLLTPGHAADQVAGQLGSGLARGGLRAVRLPALSQPDFDHLLWSCALNFVRGEDSLVRALWAGVPFVWQLYPQPDGAHAAKLDAFLDLFLAGADADLSRSLRRLFARWNGIGASSGPLELPEPALEFAWLRHCRARRDDLASRIDLATSLMEFAASKR